MSKQLIGQIIYSSVVTGVPVSATVPATGEDNEEEDQIPDKEERAPSLGSG